MNLLKVLKVVLYTGSKFLLTKKNFQIIFFEYSAKSSSFTWDNETCRNKISSYLGTQRTQVGREFEILLVVWSFMFEVLEVWEPSLLSPTAERSAIAFDLVLTSYIHCGLSYLFIWAFIASKYFLKKKENR